ncbi:YidC/Oxa1 family membrane protein insertase [Alicyclobacillus herbarius]|uniref:YidC/Oxa1 family membrane protein insertase n=1 Tax=Alicyclobacillus herbarius TaxID=122960 RepID=UPI0004242EB8|nr:YidC/Oxa1 family membrane protein insertase [Alicyclobacillus herbarius]
MAQTSHRNRKWLWLTSGLLLMFVSGCGMYPSAPGKWPQGAWGDVLKFVSHLLDVFAQALGGDYGLALLVLTVLVRLLIMPFFIKQIRYSKAMQQMQPEMARIRDKYRNDPQKMQQEMQKLWQEAGVNPMAGCFPMLLQLPVLYALFGAIEGNVHMAQSTFLGIFQLGQPDHYYILPFVAALTTFLSSRVMMIGQDMQQKWMLFVMPVFIFIMATRFASGLALYWVYTNLFTAAQAYFIRVRPGEKAQTAVAAAGGGQTAVADNPKPSGKKTKKKSSGEEEGTTGGSTTEQKPQTAKKSAKSGKREKKRR